MFRRAFRRTGRKSASAIQVFTKSKSAAPQDARERTLRAILGRDLLRHTQQNRTLCVRATPRRAFSLQERLENQQMRAWVCTSLFSLAYLFVFVAMVKVAQPFAERQLNDLAQVVAESERPRAPIVDRNGQVLAQDLPSFSLYANPRVLRKPTETARALTRIFPELGLTALTERLNSDKSFVWVRRHISPRSYEAVLALGEPGLEVIRDRRRGYPLGGLAPHVVGITDPDRHGLSGMERAFDDRLRDSTEPLVLSLDLRVQHALKDELQQALVRFSGKAAFGVVADATSGEILAMTSLPDYDPNHRDHINEATAFNHAALGVYEFGSVFKIFTLARAVDLNREILKTRYDVANPLRIGRFKITDYRPKKTSLLFPEVLVHSSNIGTVQVMESFGGENLRRGLQAFGLTTPATTELPEMGVPILPTTWRRSNYVTASYGHGISVSPLQLVRATSAVVNGGLLPAPTLLKGKSARPAPRVLSTEASEMMRSMMRLVVMEGTGRNAEAQGYLVGGKTGTANKVSPTGGYSEERVISSFLSAFPMDAPRYVVLIAVDEPQGREDTYGYATAGWVAAPATGRLVQRIAPLLGVAPVKSEFFDTRAAHLLEVEGVSEYFAMAPEPQATQKVVAEPADAKRATSGRARQETKELPAPASLVLRVKHKNETALPPAARDSMALLVQQVLYGNTP